MLLVGLTIQQLWMYSEKEYNLIPIYQQKKRGGVEIQVPARIKTVYTKQFVPYRKTL